MNPQDREQVRKCLLRFLDAKAGQRWGLSESLMLQMLRSEGFHLDRTDLAAELAYLRGKLLIAPDPKLISPENQTWHITADGRDYYATLASI